jgi:hypothetical protein
MEKSNPLPSRIPDQPPACSHLSSCKEKCQQCNINHKDVCSLRKESQSGNIVLNSKSCQRETPSFKYSISRLPRWAQANVTGYNDVCRNVSETSSEVSVLWLLFFLWQTTLYSNSLSSYLQFKICTSSFMAMQTYLEFGDQYRSRVIYLLVSLFKSAGAHTHIHHHYCRGQINYLWLKLAGFQFWKCAREN